MDTNRIAYFLGVDEVKGLPPLHGCRDDATKMNERFKQREWNAPRYECHLETDAPIAGVAQRLTADDLRTAVDTLFNPNRRLEVAVFYFAGHGAVGGTTGNKHGFYLMTSDAERPEHGVAMSYVLDAANRCAKTQERIIILDCCHAGNMGDAPFSDDGLAWLKEGVSVLAACRSKELAMETTAEGGVFTKFILEALSGGAADALGRVTLASIYAHVDLRLSLVQQRPVFKANVSRLVSLHSCAPRVDDAELRKAFAEFSRADALFPLDHTYEPAIPADERDAPVDDEHVKLFRIFQKMRAASLLEPVDDDHLYWAAYRKKPCRLTSLGQLYWDAAKIGKL